MAAAPAKAVSQNTDRLFLDDVCQTLKDTVLQQAKDASATVFEQEFQDFEMAYTVSSQESIFSLEVKYEFLQQVLEAGAQATLERVWEPYIAAMQLQVNPRQLALKVGFGQLGANAEAAGTAISMVRHWLLCGPLVERLRWLRDQTAGVAVGKGASEACPPLLRLQVRKHETCWIVVKPDRVVIYFSIHLDDEIDVSLGRAFCNEFADTKRLGSSHALPCAFSEPKDVPGDIKDQASGTPNVGYLSFAVSDQAVRNATEDRLMALAKPVMTFRNFYLFHLKNCKTFLHTRLRNRLGGWQKSLKAARRQPKGETMRRTVTGKVFNPTAR